MSALVQATERDGQTALGGNVRVSRLVATPFFEVVLWRCVEDGDGLRAERCHESPVVTLVLSGASRMHERGRSFTIEAGATVFAPPFTPYRSSHPFGCATSAATSAWRRPSSKSCERRPGAGWSAPPRLGSCCASAAPWRKSWRRGPMIWRWRRPASPCWGTL